MSRQPGIDNKWILILFLLAVSSQVTAEKAQRKPAVFNEQRFSVNFRNTPLKEVLELIASRAGMALKTEGDPKGQVNFSTTDSTLEEALREIAAKTGLGFLIKNSTIFVTQDEDAGPSEKGTAGELAFRSVPVQYADTQEILTSITKILRKGESATVDKDNNIMIVYSSEKSHQKIMEFVKLYDRKPVQILIEAQIVETTRSFARDLGVSWGDLQSPVGEPARLSGNLITPGPKSHNLLFKGLIGSVDGRALEARLTAAESNGDAKIVSRPKVFSLNNRKAIIHSGITYHIKTLSNVPTSSSGSQTSANPAAGGGGASFTGDLREISAGLQLEVTPTIVGGGLVRLIIKVQNSEPDDSVAVDGIPGIVDNTAETAILVKSNQTATMAGLVKSSLSKSFNRVPFISRLPLIGWLFSSRSDRDQSSELMIFITPRIIVDSETQTAGL